MRKKLKNAKLKKAKVVGIRDVPQTTASELNLLMNTSEDARSPLRIFAEARLTLRPADYDRAITTLFVSPAARPKLMALAFPANTSQANQWRPLATLSLHSELRWAATYLRHFALQLTKFVTASTLLRAAFLRGDRDVLVANLGSMRGDFQNSIWLCVNTIATFQRYFGLEAQKRYVAATLEQPIAPLLAIILHYVSLRNEGSVTPSQYDEIMNSLLAGQEMPHHVRTFLAFHLSDRSALPTNVFAHVLAMSATGPIIDYYESFVSVLQHIAARGDLHILADPTLLELAYVVNDPRLTALHCLLTDRAMPTHPGDAMAVEAVERFVFGDYDAAWAAAMAGLDRFPDHPDLIEIAAMCGAILPERVDRRSPMTIKSLIALVASVMIGAETAEDDQLAVTQLLANYDLQHVAALLAWLMQRETSPPTVVKDPRAALMEAMFPFRFIRRGGVVDERHVREFVAVHGPGRVATYLSVLAGLRNIGRDEDWICAKPERYLILAGNLMREGAADEAAAVARELGIASQDPYYRRAAMRIHASSLLVAGHVRLAITAVVEACLGDRLAYRRVPVEETVLAVEVAGREQFAAVIHTPILYDIFSKTVGATHDAQRRYAYEDFVAAHRCAKPSQLRPLAGRFQKAALVYFLRDVCTESTMERSDAFETSRELSEERIAICELLTEIDPLNSERYHAESREVLKRLGVLKRMRQIEQSKMYVDSGGRRLAMVKRLREHFNRYSALRDIQLSPETWRAIAAAIKELGSTPAKIELIVPGDELHAVLDRMIVEARDEYVSGEFGLDGYLSVRVRHGTLAGQLRESLETEKLITRRAADTGAYQKNRYWLRRLNLKGKRELRAAGSFSQLAHSYDALIDEITSRWVQVKTHEAQAGAFDFSLTQDLMVSLKQDLSGSENVEEFVETVVRTFDRMLERNLASVRDRLMTEAKPRATALLHDLQRDLDSFLPSDVRGHFNSTVSHTRTETQRAFDRVAEWFRPPVVDLHDPFTLEEAVRICVESARVYDSSFEAIVEEQGEPPGLVRGALLSSIFDLFLTAFENVIRHAGTVHPDARIVIQYSDYGTAIRIENALADGVASDSARARIAVLKLQIEKKRHASVAREGGTGFLKMWKTLRSDLGIESPRFQFDFEGTDVFAVEFELPANDEIVERRAQSARMGGSNESADRRG